jgi:hypothetical protein
VIKNPCPLRFREIEAEHFKVLPKKCTNINYTCNLATSSNFTGNL